MQARIRSISGNNLVKEGGKMPENKVRCPFVTGNPPPLYLHYHDQEWGVPVHDDDRLFELLTLEGAQAGLSWLTVLKRREAYQEHFDQFQVESIADYDAPRIAALLTEPSLIRNRRKIESVVSNARAFLQVAQTFGSFNAFLWQFVDGRPLINHWRKARDIPAQTALSQRISRELYARSFTFVGPTIVYAYLQATGVVMDHIVDCFRYRELGGKD